MIPIFQYFFKDKCIYSYLSNQFLLFCTETWQVERNARAHSLRDLQPPAES